METTRTIILKLKPSLEQCAEINLTLLAFASACNHIADVIRREGTTNRISIQKACYREVRDTFGLSANLTLRAISRACTALKAPGRANSWFRPTSIDYDARIFSFREREWTVSLTLLNSRQRIETIPGEHQKGILKGTKPTSASLVNRDGVFFLNIQIKTEAHDPIDPVDFIGVDVGIAQIATTSDDPNGYCGKAVEAVRRKHNLQRKRLQKRGTKGAKKKLRRISGKESRFRKHENHRISKSIVQTAKDTGRGIAIEDLKGIRGRITARSGDARNRLSSWSFSQLFSIIQCKATDAGIPIVQVDPRNTSKACSVCGYCERANRKTQAEFSCLKCGFSANADWNAARNIRALANSKVATGLAALEAKTGNRTAAKASRKSTAPQCG